jgi:WS/DGAT/MGAT family acyltransferase
LLDDVSGFAGGVADRVKAMGASLTSGWLLPTGKTPINGDIGPNRRFEWLETPLADVKAVKNGLGGSVNDVVLATVAGGVRRYLIEHRGMTEAEIEDVDFRAMAPVSIRTKDQRGTLGNQVAMWLVTMPIADPDPRARLAAVRRETSHLKQTDQALGAHTLVRVSAGAPATLVSLGARLAANARPFNITVTNVPGPQFPLYLLGAQMVATYPLVPLWRSHGVGVALFSYDGTVFWGFNADYDLVADIDDFAAAMAASFAELSAAAGEAQPEPPVPRSAPRGDRTRPKSRPPLGTR